MQYVYWFRELANLRDSWAKELKYGELYVNGFPIPSGFVIVPGAKEFISQAIGVANISHISPSSIPEKLRKKIVDCYFSLDSGIDYDALTADAQSLVNAGRRASLVSVHSKSREFKNIRGSGRVLEAVLRCMSGGGPVVIQKSVCVEKSGISIVRSGGAVIQSIYGDLKHLLNKNVEPDVFYISPHDDSVQSKKLGSKEFALVVGDDGTSRRVSVSQPKKVVYSLQQKEIEVVNKLTKKVEQNYPGKTIYWGITGRRVYLLGLTDVKPDLPALESSSYGAAEQQSYSSPSPAVESSLASIFNTPEPTSVASEQKEENNLFSSFSSSSASEPAQQTENNAFDFLENSQNNSSSEPEQKTESGFGSLFDGDYGSEKKEENSSTERVRNFESEKLGSVFSTPSSPQVLTPAPQKETHDNIFSSSGDFFSEPAPQETEKNDHFSKTSSTSFSSSDFSSSSPMSSEKMKVGIFIDDHLSAEQAIRNNPSTVLVNLDKFLENNYNPSFQSPQASFESLAKKIYSVLKSCANLPINIKLSDKGAEQTSFFGLRGSRRLNSRELEMEFAAISKAIEELQRIGVSVGKINILLPFITNVSEISHAEKLLVKHRLTGRAELGIVIETPASASIAKELCGRSKFVAVNIDNLAQHMLAVDKNDEKVKHLYDYKHAAVFNALRDVANSCKQQGAELHAFGDALDDSDVIGFLKEQGYGGIIANKNNFDKLNSADSPTNNSEDSWFGSSSSESTSYW